jgi:hypothetical protein
MPVHAHRTAHLAHVAGPASGLQNGLSHGLGPQVVILRGNDDSVPGAEEPDPPVGRHGEFIASTHGATAVAWCPHVAEGAPRHPSHASTR